ncbi:DUF262 domain-containing protein [Actinomadura verrucosospora]|uniref:DUF262 domain-containing protein n=1 Tax=Actinomadura verrucosospora TaxID=46165 RepID=UPI0015647AD7|nr:DUF262 domain-containing protein [Actinomadura verrucosospora]
MTVGDLLRENHPFFVPRYQRSYAWESQVSAFTDDIKDLLAGDPHETSHFFGGLVCIEHTDHTQPRPHKYEIVDGQQRLATIVLALGRIYRAGREVEAAAEEAGDEAAKNSARTLAEDTRESFLVWKKANVSAGTIEYPWRLSLSLADDGFFRGLLEGMASEPKRESHELLAAAEAYIDSALIAPALGRESLQQQVAELDRLRRAITSQSHVILIVCSDRERAYQLFSVLNDRGRSLEDADLLRSYTLEVLQEFPEHQERAAEIWDKILSSPSKEVSDFFLTYFPSTTGRRTSVPMFKDLRAEYFPSDSATSPGEADVVVDRITRFHDEQLLWEKLRKGGWPYADHPAVKAWHKDRLKRLVIALEHTLAMPLLLAAARCVDAKRFADLVYMLEIFAFRYKNVCNGHATAPGKLYYAVARATREKTEEGNAVNWSHLRSKLQELINKSASDEQFKASLQSRLRYDFGGAQRRNIRELLTILEEHGAWLNKGGHGNPKPDMMMVFDLNEVTIEHIYPQKPSSADFASDLHEVRHRIGNLTFFSPKDNSDAGNKSFVIKRDNYYCHSRVRMTNDLASLEQWTMAEYEKRMSNILKDACRVFRLP